MSIAPVPPTLIEELLLFDADFHRDPYPVYDKLRGHGPVQQVKVSSHGHHVWLITGYAEARAALADPRLSKDTCRFGYLFGDRRDIAPALRDTMLATDPPDHTRLRRLAAQAFTVATVDRLRPRIQQITDQLLETISLRGTADLISEFAVPLPVTIICELLGVPEQDRPQLRTWSNTLFAAGRPADRDQASHHIADYMTRLVATKYHYVDRDASSPGGENLLDSLIAARQRGDRLSQQEVVSLAALLLVAGHETTTNLIGNTVLALLLHPAQRAAVTTAPDRLAPAIEEFLRYDSPLGIATVRFTTEPVTYGSTTIPAEHVVMVSIGAANRDPVQYPAPAALNFTRTRLSPGHLAFGHGPHYCLGSALARAEAHTALAGILHRLPDLRLDTTPEQLTWRPSRMMRGLRTLPVRWNAIR